MTRTRWPVVIVLLVAVVLLVAWFPGRSGVAPSRVLRAPVAAAVGVEGGSWYCAARDIAVETFTHTVIISDVGEDEATVHLDGFSDEGPAGSAELIIDPGATLETDVATTLGTGGLSVMIEADAPVVVEHRYAYDGGADQAPCSNFSSDTWYFPAVVTTRDAAARLSLFNPFPGDASVDIEVAFDTGVRQPTKLSGLVVPAGSTRVVELGEQVQRREQFSATVRTRSGGVVAELAERFDGSAEVEISGLRLVPGSRTASARWSFAGGFADPSATERLVVLNPNDEAVDVIAQVVPFGGTDVLPEPFEFEVPPLRYATIDLEADSRVPAVGNHAIDLETVEGERVVAARAINVTAEADGGDAAPLRTLVTSGTTASPGAPAGAPRWVSAGMQRSEELDSAVFVHNPADSQTVASIRAVSGDGELGAAVEYEIPAGDSVMVPASELIDTAEPFTALVESEDAVVVERLIVFRSAPDLSLQPSIPVLGSLDDLALLAG